jgi:hypothetical protein
MQDTLLVISLFAAIFAVPGCAENIGPTSNDPDAGDPIVGEPDAGPAGPVRTVRDPDGTAVTRIDSTSMTEWIHVDLDTGAEVDATAGWDIATQRYRVQLNGGVSGSAGVELVPVVGADFKAMAEAPAIGWVTDAADGADENMEPDLAFEQADGWYAYDQGTHILMPRPIVWAVRTSERAVLKLVFESYYDDAGTSGHLRMRWAPLGGNP